MLVVIVDSKLQIWLFECYRAPLSRRSAASASSNPTLRPSAFRSEVSEHLSSTLERALSGPHRPALENDTYRKMYPVLFGIQTKLMEPAVDSLQICNQFGIFVPLKGRHRNLEKCTLDKMDHTTNRAESFLLWSQH
jgi:hypothetical protein